ncbi:GNAT family N-acetyltransferase [Heyndrickxia acidiproducens]|uniref:GNAT family N-acetyltransferase n=1 Tax=Heyndrickxia acidiproducens TaxID=1121084 RepID=UPI00277D10F9|nr:GNAT family N-acetyltransferase [Heyndrickxia acidiproducens]
MYKLKIKFAELSDAKLIHDLMIKAFMGYKEEIPPSSALEESVASISAALKNNEKGLVAYIDEMPVGMVRFQLTENGLYFYRLSVIPEEQGKGIAKKILKALEKYARDKDLPALYCKVRLTIKKNINLYRSVGYTIYNEEVVTKPNGIEVKVVLMKKDLYKVN